MNLERGEVHYRVSGLWDMPTMMKFQSELLAKSKPLIDAGRKIHALGEMAVRASSPHSDNTSAAAFHWRN